MSIDIDSFLDDFDSKDNKEKPVEKTEKKKIDLTFNKYIGDKINKLQEDVNEEDFSFLVKAYSEIKKFDNTLPNKLLELNKISGNTLTNLGEKYTTTFLQGIRANKSKHENFINTNLINISSLINEKKIPKAIELYNKITKSYKLFPKEFIIEKIEIGKKLREIEIKINQEFTLFWAKELDEIKIKLSNEISILKLNLVPGKIEIIESNLHNINNILDNSPSIFYNELIKERIQVSKIIIISEEFLKKQYIIEFEDKMHEFKKLFDRFHKYQIRKDVTAALTCYDEILYLFEKMPDAFIEKKIEIYRKINKSFESINNLILSTSINQFMDTYNSSKILSQAREYINMGKHNLEFDTSNLISIKNQLDGIPHQLSIEKEEIENDIAELLHRKTIKNSKIYLDEGFKNKKFDLEILKSHYDKLQNVPETLDNRRNEILDKISNIISRVNNINNIKKINKKKEKIELENVFSKIEIGKEKVICEQQDINSNIDQMTKQSEKKHNQEILIDIKSLNQNKINEVTRNMIEEINSNFIVIQESSDIGVIERLTKKNSFYISLLPLNNSQKENIGVILNNR